MKPLFYKGQIVTCVDSTGDGFDDGTPWPLIEGKKYTISNPEYRNGIKSSCCGVELFNVVGVFDQTRFVPLEDDNKLEDEIKSALNERLLIQ